MLNCDTIKLDLSAYHDGALPPQERAAVESHLSECVACKAELSEIERARAALAALPKLKAPSGLNAKIKAQIALEPSCPKESPPLQLRRVSYSWLAITSGIAATLAIAALCYVSFVKSTSDWSSKAPSLAKQAEPPRDRPVALNQDGSDKPALRAKVESEALKKAAEGGAEKDLSALHSVRERDVALDAKAEYKKSANGLNEQIVREAIRPQSDAAVAGGVKPAVDAVKKSDSQKGAIAAEKPGAGKDVLGDATKFKELQEQQRSLADDKSSGAPSRPQVGGMPNKPPAAAARPVPPIPGPASAETDPESTVATPAPAPKKPAAGKPLAPVVPSAPPAPAASSTAAGPVYKQEGVANAGAQNQPAKKEDESKPTGVGGFAGGGGRGGNRAEPDNAPKQDALPAEEREQYNLAAKEAKKDDRKNSESNAKSAAAKGAAEFKDRAASADAIRMKRAGEAETANEPRANATGLGPAKREYGRHILALLYTRDLVEVTSKLKTIADAQNAVLAPIDLAQELDKAKPPNGAERTTQFRTAFSITLDASRADAVLKEIAALNAREMDRKPVEKSLAPTDASIAPAAMAKPEPPAEPAAPAAPKTLDTPQASPAAALPADKPKAEDKVSIRIEIIVEN